MKTEIMDRVNGPDLGNGPRSRDFFHARGYANRHPNQSNIGDCMLLNLLEAAAREAGNERLQREVSNARD
jgi:hypothetical protein